MHEEPLDRITCLVCNAAQPSRQIAGSGIIRKPIAEVIQKENPGWSSEDPICLSCLNFYRAKYVQHVLEVEKGELSEIEEHVVRSLRDHELLSENLNVEFDSRLTFGEKLADRVAEFGGSWRFIIIFGVVIAVWVGLNLVSFFGKSFDPYPFILLNLCLSCLAAIQAPIIMMSQNRQEAKDRLRSEHEYLVNLKAELEIRHLNLKLDRLLSLQWQRLLEIQQIQMELMEQVLSAR